MTPAEIRSRHFERVKKGGYDSDEVNAYLGEVAAVMDSVLADREDMENKMFFLAEKLEEYKALENSMRTALVGAQQLGEQVISEANTKSEQILNEAQAKALEIVSKAQMESDKMMVNVKRNIDTEVYTLNRLKVEVARFKSQVTSMYQKHLDLISAIPYDEEKYSEMPPRPEHLETVTAEVEKVAVIDTGNASMADETMPLQREETVVRWDDDSMTTPVSTVETQSEVFSKSEFAAPRSKETTPNFGEGFRFTKED